VWMMIHIDDDGYRCGVLRVNTERGYLRANSSFVRFWLVLYLSKSYICFSDILQLLLNKHWMNIFEQI
jgi:hypothetical protein